MNYAIPIGELFPLRPQSLNGCGSAFQEMVEDVENSLKQYFLPISRTRPEFYDRLEQWRNDTRFLSSTNSIAMHPDYQRIIGMGEEALPFIFKEMKNKPGQYFWALRAITGENPVKLEDRGDIKKMTESWLEWARMHGF